MWTRRRCAAMGDGRGRVARLHGPFQILHTTAQHDPYDRGTVGGPGLRGAAPLSPGRRRLQRGRGSGSSRVPPSARCSSAFTNAGLARARAWRRLTLIAKGKSTQPPEADAFWRKARDLIEAHDLEIMAAVRV